MKPYIRSCLLALLLILWMPGIWVEAARLPEVMVVLDGSGSIGEPTGTCEIRMIFSGSDEPLLVGECVDIRQSELCSFGQWCRAAQKNSTLRKSVGTPEECC